MWSIWEKVLEGSSAEMDLNYRTIPWRKDVKWNRKSELGQLWVSLCKVLLFFEKENILEKRGAKYGNMQRLDQGNLHPILEQPETDMFRPGVEPGPLRLDASILEKSNSNSFLIAIRNIYMNRR